MIAQKKALAIHDISCMGRCSLTVALPILSVAGIETSILPTAILSTHTGGFKNYTFRDLSDDIMPIVQHWKTLPHPFDAIYTGYVANIEQIETICMAIDTIADCDTILIVDPVMGDNGSLYAGFPANFPIAMKALLAKATIAIPNITEACFLLDEPYLEEGYDEAYIERLVKGIAKLGPKQVVLTGVQYEKDSIGVTIYDTKSDKISYFCDKKIAGSFHGTGDIFSSTVVSGILRGLSLAQATQLAIHYTCNSIALTVEANATPQYGVYFELAMPALLRELEGMLNALPDTL